MSTGPVLIYDGDCKFCQLSLEFGIRNLPTFPKYVAFQKINPETFGLTSDQVKREIWLVDLAANPKQQFGGHLAAAEILLSQPNAFLRMAGWIIKTPPTSWLAKHTYRWIANNRHRLPGGTRQCSIQDTYSDETRGS